MTRLLCPDDATDILGVSRKAVFDAAKGGRLPDPVRHIGGGRKGGMAWREADLTSFVNDYVKDIALWRRDVEFVLFAAETLGMIMSDDRADGTVVGFHILAKRLAGLGHEFLGNVGVPLPARKKVGMLLMNVRWEECTGDVSEGGQAELQKACFDVKSLYTQRTDGPGANCGSDPAPGRGGKKQKRAAKKPGHASRRRDR